MPPTISGTGASGSSAPTISAAVSITRNGGAAPMALVVVMGTGRLGGGRGGGGGGGRRAQRRARTRANARREARARDSLKRLSVPAVDARARRHRSSVRAAKAGRHLHPHSVRPAGPGVTRAVARARPRRGRTRSRPSRRARPTRGWEPRARARSSPSHLWGTPVRPRRTIRDPTGWVFRTRGFLAGFSRPRAPHDARRAGGSGEGLLERFAPRRLHRAVVEAPPPMACAAECANGTARCAPKRVEKL